MGVGVCVCVWGMIEEVVQCVVGVMVENIVRNVCPRPAPTQPVKKVSQQSQRVVRKLTENLVKTYLFCNEMYRKKKMERASFFVGCLQKVSTSGRAIFVREKCVGNYLMKEELGSGAFSNVFRVTDMRFDKTEYALKMVKNGRAFYEAARDEKTVWDILLAIDATTLRANYVFEPRAAFNWQGHRCFLMQLYRWDLYKLMRQRQYWTTSVMTHVKTISKEVCTGLKFIHGLGITHCDLKLENILVHPHGVVLGDFGSSQVGQSKHPMYQQSRFYRAPEVVLGHVSTTKIDMWSLGVLMIELLTGRSPFVDKIPEDLMLHHIELTGMPTEEMLQLSQRNMKSVFTRPHLDNSTVHVISMFRDDAYHRSANEVVRGKEYTVLDLIQRQVDRGESKNKTATSLTPLFGQYLRLVERLLVMNPSERISAATALEHPFFDD